MLPDRKSLSSDEPPGKESIIVAQDVSHAVLPPEISDPDPRRSRTRLLLDLGLSLPCPGKRGKPVDPIETRPSVRQTNGDMVLLPSAVEPPPMTPERQVREPTAGDQDDPTERPSWILFVLH